MIKYVLTQKKKTVFKISFSAKVCGTVISLTNYKQNLKKSRKSACVIFACLKIEPIPGTQIVKTSSCSATSKHKSNAKAIFI